MRIGVPTEIKVRESRLALVPAGARELVADGHEVLVQTGAGDGVLPSGRGPRPRCSVVPISF